MCSQLLGIIKIKNMVILWENHCACHYRTCQRTPAYFINATEISQIIVFVFIFHHMFHTEAFFCKILLFFLVLCHKLSDAGALILTVLLTEALPLSLFCSIEFCFDLTDGFHLSAPVYSAHSNVTLPIFPLRKSSKRMPDALV